MDAEVAGRRIAQGGGHVIGLAVHTDLSADSIAVAAGPFQFEDQPGVFTGGDVLPQLRSFAQRGDDRVNPAVIVEVGKGGAPVRPRREKTLPYSVGHVLESSVASVQED